MINKSIEQSACDHYLSISNDEVSLGAFMEEFDDINQSSIGMIITEGFEERSIGLLRKMYLMNIKMSCVILGRYEQQNNLNIKYRNEFDKLCREVSSGKFKVISNMNDGKWVSEAISLADCNTLLLDITAFSNRGLFGALDSAAKSTKKIYIVYSEADEYWPKKSHWEKTVKKQLSPGQSIRSIVDEMPWMFGYEHRVELIENYEGYDSASAKRALIGFLPFKSARIASIIDKENYWFYYLIAGRPRLKQNIWRLEAQKRINEEIIKNWPIITIDTFGYRNSLKHLMNILTESDYSLLDSYDVHLAILGSKLQSVGCWVLCNIIKSITVITSVPAKYFSKAFSEGIGETWVFPLTPIPKYPQRYEATKE